MRRRRDSGSQVQAITSVRRALAEDVHDRTIRYLVSMGIRTGCILLLFVVPGPWKWLCLVGAVLLPLLAVLVANAGREKPEPSTNLLPGGPGDPGQLGIGPARPLPYDPYTEYLR